MGKEVRAFAVLLIIVLSFFASIAAAAPLKVAIFDVQTTNQELDLLARDLTSMLRTCLTAEAGFTILDRKILAEFLALNELDQKSNLENVLNIGARLELDAVVTGTVEKRASVLLINYRMVGVRQKRALFSQQVRSLGDTNLASEMAVLGKAVATSIANMGSKAELPPALLPPINVRVIASTGQMQLSWEAPLTYRPTAYDVYRATSKEGPFAKIAQVKNPAYQDRSMEQKVASYYYKIRAYNEDGFSSEDSALVFAEPVFAPYPPIIFKAESHIKSIQITWTANPLGTASRLRGYKLYRAESQSGPFKEVANIQAGKAADADATAAPDKLPKLNFTDKGLNDGGTYYYKITAYDERNLESDYSTPLRGFTTPPLSDVIAQSDLLREVRLSWAAIEAADVQGYNVYRSTTEKEGFTKIARVGKAPPPGETRIQYRDREAQADMVRYYYRITAFETPELETAPGVIVSAQTKGKPLAPKDVKAVSGLVKRVEIAWTPSTAEEVEGYNLYGSQQNDGEFVLIKKLIGRNNGKYLDEERGSAKLEDNGAYYYRLASYNVVGAESPFVAVTAKTKPRPAAPGGLKAETTKLREASLSWQANPESDISAYHVWRSDAEGGGFKELAKIVMGVAHRDGNLKDGATYHYKLQAEDRDGLLSDFSDTLAVKAKSRPRSPAGLSGDIHSGSVYLKWAATPDIDHYEVYEKKPAGGREKIMEVQAAVFNEQAPAKGKGKTYVVIAVDKDGLESDPSQEITLKRK